MLNYQLAAFRPTVAPLALGPDRQILGRVPLLDRPSTPGILSGGTPALAQTFEDIAGWPKLAGDTLRLTFHGGTAWLGVYVGLNDKNKWISGVAWVLGIGNGLAAIADALSIVKRLTGVHPAETAPS